VLGWSTPIFFALKTALPRTAGVSPREVADIGRNVPGGRALAMLRRDTRVIQTPGKGGFEMAKKGSKKKAAKKK
jgi:hypothetical protein